MNPFKPIRIQLNPPVYNNWSSRCVSDVIQKLAEKCGNVTDVIYISRVAARAVIADCDKHLNPIDANTTLLERCAYSYIRNQCEFELSKSSLS